MIVLIIKMASTKYDKLLIKRTRGLQKSLNRVEKNIDKILTNSLSSFNRSNVYWNKVRSDLKVQYKKANDIYKEWSTKNYPKFYDGVVKEQMLKADSLKNISNTAKLSTPDLINTNYSTATKTILTQSAIADMSTGLAVGLKNMERLTRVTQQTLINEWLIDKSIVDAVNSGNLRLNTILKRSGSLANRLSEQAENKRFITIIDKNGKPINYRISYYSELVTRTKWHDAQSQGVKAVAANYDTDLVRVSSHNTITEICQKYEGKILSISGKSKDFAVLDQAPPFHVNCLHYLTVVFRESLEVTGDYSQASGFSRDLTDKPPNPASFVPVEKRNKIANETAESVKGSLKYRHSTAKEKRSLLRKEVSGAIGFEGREEAKVA